MLTFEFKVPTSVREAVEEVDAPPQGSGGMGTGRLRAALANSTSIMATIKGTVRCRRK
jgi:hypothetical protein